MDSTGDGSTPLFPTRSDRCRLIRLAVERLPNTSRVTRKNLVELLINILLSSRRDNSVAMEVIAHKIGRSPRHTQRLLNKAEDLGLLVVDRGREGRTRGSNSIFELRLGHASRSRAIGVNDTRTKCPHVLDKMSGCRRQNVRVSRRPNAPHWGPTRVARVLQASVRKSSSSCLQRDRRRANGGGGYFVEQF